MSELARQAGLPLLDPLREAAIQLPQGLPPLGRRFGGDQIRQTFHLGQIELACIESAPGESTRFGGHAVRQTPESIQYGRDNRAASMQVKLHHVFTGKAGRTRKPENQTAIQQFATIGVVQCGERCPPGRWRRLASQALQCRRGLGSGDSKHGHPCPPGTAGGGEDRLAHETGLKDRRNRGITAFLTHPRWPAAPKRQRRRRRPGAFSRAVPRWACRRRESPEGCPYPRGRKPA